MVCIGLHCIGGGDDSSIHYRLTISCPRPIPAVLYIICSVFLCKIYFTWTVGAPSRAWHVARDPSGLLTSSFAPNRRWSHVTHTPHPWLLASAMTQCLSQYFCRSIEHKPVNRVLTWIISTVRCSIPRPIPDIIQSNPSVCRLIASLCYIRLWPLWRSVGGICKIYIVFLHIICSVFLVPTVPAVAGGRVKEEIAFLSCKNFQPTNLFPTPSYFIPTLNSNIQDLFQGIY